MATKASRPTSARKSAGKSAVEKFKADSRRAKKAWKTRRGETAKTVDKTKPEPALKIADELNSLHFKVETAADNLGELVGALGMLANVTALRAIAELGSAEDREIALKSLKAWFPEDFREDKVPF